MLNLQCKSQMITHQMCLKTKVTKSQMGIHQICLKTKHLIRITHQLVQMNFPFQHSIGLVTLQVQTKNNFSIPLTTLSNTQKNWMKYSPIQLLLISIHTSLTIYYFEPYQIMSPNYCFKYNFFQSREFMFFCIIPLQSKMLGKSKSI